MKSKNLILISICILTFFIISGCRPEQQTTDDTTTDLYANYVGSQACAGCHSSQYNKFIKSGHPYKLTKVENGQKPTFPFTTLPDIPNATGLKNTINSLGAPQSYADVSYVIGGYNWKARFVDVNGYIITGSDVQYNFETGGWVAYHGSDVDVPYNCGKCHTTGWIAFEDGGQRQDSLPGMDGTFFKGGVQCEECHGPGAAHVANGGGKDTISVDYSAEQCGKCHTRDSQRRIASSGGYIKHHEQYDELLGKNPDTMQNVGKHLKSNIGCNQCHDPHASTVNQDKTGVKGVSTDCIQCHSDRVIVSGRMAGMDCIECHMPKLAKSAVGHTGTGTGPNIGDIKSHIFKIDLSKADNQQFTTDGKFANPWLTGKTACKHCHNGVQAFDIGFPSGMKIHK